MLTYAFMNKIILEHLQHTPKFYNFMIMPKFVMTKLHFMNHESKKWKMTLLILQKRAGLFKKWLKFHFHMTAPLLVSPSWCSLFHQIDAACSTELMQLGSNVDHLPLLRLVLYRSTVPNRLKMGDKKFDSLFHHEKCIVGAH